MLFQSFVRGRYIRLNMIPIIGRDFSKILIDLIDKAKTNIDIVVYDWRWYADQNTHPVQQFNMAIVRAVHRGVIVRAVLNSRDLVPFLNTLGIRAKRLKDRRVVHSKLFLIDQKTLVIGSHNYTRNAFGSNIETSIAVELPEEITRFSDFFENLYSF